MSDRTLWYTNDETGHKDSCPKSRVVRFEKYVEKHMHEERTFIVFDGPSLDRFPNPLLVREDIQTLTKRMESDDDE